MKGLKKARRIQKVEEQHVKTGSKNRFPHQASGMADSSGGSRQGNIGHQGDDSGENSHR